MSGETTQYALDLNAGLTQVLDDDTYSYTYGVGRISQQRASLVEYFLGDALGSTRQLANAEGAVVLFKSYAPYGELMEDWGEGSSPFGYTGEQTDPNGLVYLRARHYDPGMGRFLTRDTWGGDVNNPITLNHWVYANANPVFYTDPSGNIQCPPPYESYNTCTMQDWYAYAGIEFLSMFGFQGHVDNYHINIGDSSINPTGYAFQKTFETYGAAGEGLGKVADIGLSAMPGGGIVYDSYNALSGENLFSGYVYSPSERYLGLAFLGIGGFGDLSSSVCKSTFQGSADEVFTYAIRQGILDPAYQRSVKGFVGRTVLITLDEDITVLQYTSKGKITPWFTTRTYIKPGNRRRFLALPRSNTGEEVVKYIIPKDTPVIIGQVASQTHNLIGFGTYATGGGFQIYLPDISKAIKVP